MGTLGQPLAQRERLSEITTFGSQPIRAFEIWLARFFLKKQAQSANVDTTQKSERQHIEAPRQKEIYMFLFVVTSLSSAKSNLYVSKAKKRN